MFSFKNFFLAVTILVLLFSLFLYDYLTVEFVFANISQINIWIEKMGTFSILAFFFIYVLIVAFSIPAASLFSILAGYLYGSVTGGILAVISASTGAIILFFLVKRDKSTKFINSVKNHKSFSNFQQGITRNLYSYLLITRLLPIVPFWLANLAPPLLGVSFKAYSTTTFFGIIPGTFIVSSIGNQIRLTLDSENFSYSDLLMESNFLVFGALLALMVFFTVICKSFYK